MESTLFTALSTNEEASLSGGATFTKSFNGNNISLGNTAVAIPISVVLGGTGSISGKKNGNVLTGQYASANAGNILGNSSNVS
ncbi:MAG: hypothetical protein ACYTXA_04605 [Nostoc sp.]